MRDRLFGCGPAMTVGMLQQSMAGKRGQQDLRLRRCIVACAATLAGFLLTIGAGPALAQLFSFPPRPKPEVRQAPTNGQMLVQAGEIHYDYANRRVSAVNNVQIYYKGSTLEADRVVYDQKNRRLRAEGSVRLTEPNGQVTYGEILELSDDYRDGFVDSLRIELPDRSRIAATRVERSGGRFSVFESSVYTACEPCKDNPKKPPLWQVKAARIIHDQAEHMIYFEDASLEFFGHPIAYLPYLSTPDPTVKRKTGLLLPITMASSRIGYAFGVPLFWAIAPDYDLTLTPVITTRQGALLSAEWRQRLTNGAFFIRGAGIWQQDQSAFVFDGLTPTTPQPGNREFRGSIESAGQFALNNKWVWGWDAIVPTDAYFFRDYPMMSPQRPDLTRNPRSEGISDLYLVGRGDRSYFDARSIYFYGFSALDSQEQIPVVHPVVDYSYIYGQPVYGGELGYRVNVTSLSRKQANFDSLVPTEILGSPTGPIISGPCGPLSPNPAVDKNPTNCLLRGFPGTYSRLSAEMHWRRTLVDGMGQMFTPFASLRADAAAVSVTNEAGVSNYLPVGDQSVTRVMPTVGVEYRFPFIGVQSWGTQTVEPIAQVIVRPNETHIGQLPNEDSQSLLFDGSNLFKVDKFSGWDRVEGGGRANVGILYTAQVNRAGFFNVLFGQSYQLFGLNSYAVADATNTGLGSGLETDRSDYVANVAYQPNRFVSLASRFRFDNDNFSVQRFELEGRTAFDRWTLGMTYGLYAAQPAIGFLTQREGVAGTAQVKVAPNWNLLASARYDIDERKVTGTALGVGYVDDCFILGINYLTNYNYIGTQETDHIVVLQVALRTLGGVAAKQTVAGPDTQ